jgi:hypothetical protein
MPPINVIPGLIRHPDFSFFLTKPRDLAQTFGANNQRGLPLPPWKSDTERGDLVFRTLHVRVSSCREAWGWLPLSLSQHSGALFYVRPAKNQRRWPMPQTSHLISNETFRDLYDNLGTLNRHIRSIHIIGYLMTALDELKAIHFEDRDAVEVADLLMHLVTDMEDATQLLEELIDRVKENTKED